MHSELDAQSKSHTPLLAQSEGNQKSHPAMPYSTHYYLAASSRRTISAPAVNAFSLPRAIWRGNGAMPQLVHG